MIPLGYMAKRVVDCPDWLNAGHVREICSVSSCVSEDFCDYIDYWKHNGYWFFNSPEVIVAVATENDIDLVGARFFYYEAYESEYDDDGQGWTSFSPEESSTTEVIRPGDATLQGYDIATFSAGNMAECSPLSCNHMAESVQVNEHCLLSSLETGIALLEAGIFQQCEPGPYRIITVYTIDGAQQVNARGRGIAGALPRR